MQAYGRYDFNATATDELSFPKGAMLKVSWTFSMKEDCRHSMHLSVDP